MATGAVPLLAQLETGPPPSHETQTPVSVAAAVMMGDAIVYEAAALTGELKPKRSGKSSCLSAVAT